VRNTILSDNSGKLFDGLKFLLPFPKCQTSCNHVAHFTLYLHVSRQKGVLLTGDNACKSAYVLWYSVRAWGLDFASKKRLHQI